MKPAESAALIKSCLERGYVEHEDVFYPPAIAAALNIKPATKPKKKRAKPRIYSDSVDQFCMLISQQLQVIIRMEYRFNLERQWRFDYAIPDQMIAIECEGGIWTRGRHTRGAGYVADMEKYTDAAIKGWVLIRITPKNLLTSHTVDLIKQAINGKL